jgi:succinate dehydrogenase / fumarate reductase cytochrome b subunit
MSILKNLYDMIFGSSIGKKWIVAITGILLILFLIGHLVGNLQIFLDAGMVAEGKEPTWINSYAHKLMTFPLLWPIRIGLFAIFALHVFTTILLVKENRAARANRVGKEQRVQAKWATRTMAVSGLIVLSFVVFHILHFTTKDIPGKDYTELPKVEIKSAEEPVTDVYSMMVAGFAVPWVAWLYIVAMALLCTHLSHGFYSVFQTLGINGPKLDPFLRICGYAFAILIFVGFTSIPLAVQAGAIKSEAADTFLEKHVDEDELLGDPDLEPDPAAKPGPDDSAAAH